MLLLFLPVNRRCVGWPFSEPSGRKERRIQEFRVEKLRENQGSRRSRNNRSTFLRQALWVNPMEQNMGRGQSMGGRESSDPGLQDKVVK